MTTAERAVLGEIADAELCRRDLLRFLRHVKVRGDDPLHPVIAPWEPWPHLIERAGAWAGGASEVVLKDRQLGFTWFLAAYFNWRARSGWSCGVISKGQDEARAVLSRVKFVEDSLPEYLRSGASFRADEANYPSGGMIHAFPSTPDAGVSYTLQLVAFDEAAFHPYGGSNYAAIRPTISAGGQILITSTADPELSASGFMYDIYWASKRGETGYKAVFVPWHARPGRDAAWLERERAAYTGHPDAFSAYYAETDAEAFVGRAGLFYPMFSEERHVKPKPCEWGDCKFRVVGLDWGGRGGGNPMAIVPLGVTGMERIHQFGEFYEQRVDDPLTAAASYIMDLHRRGRVDLVVYDPSEDSMGRSLAAVLALEHIPCVAANNDREKGLGHISWLLSNDLLTISPVCKESIAEFPLYRTKRARDPNDKSMYATSSPVAHHGDAMDGRRYAAVAILEGIVLRFATGMEMVLER